MAETLLIDAVPGETRAALIEDGRPIEIVYLREGRESRVGQVYLGRVQRILSGVQAAFVDLGLDRAGFLSLGATDDPLQEGKAVVLQVVKDAIGHKGVQLTRRIAIPGRTLVLTPQRADIQISRRIVDEAEQARLTGIVSRIAGQGEGFILRTAAAGASEAEIVADAARVRAAWAAVEAGALTRRAPALLWEGPDALERLLIEFTGAATKRVVFGDRATFSAARQLAQRGMTDLAERLELHLGEEELFEAWGVEGEIEQALSASVRLPSGGEIIIEATEALTVIDVNTASHVGEGRAEETLLRTNLEAALEIARQLRLRAIGGMTVIDFAHMGEEGSWNRVLAELGTALMRDRSAARVLGRTAGGLVEVTRRRSREPLAQLLTGSWRGRSVRSVETAVYEALRAVRREAGRRPGRLQVAVAPEVAAALEGPHLTALSEAIGREVIVVPEPAWPRGRIEIAAR